MKLVLLPGMDGTAKLFASFIEALPRSLDAIAVPYPSDHYLSYVELERLVRLACPNAEPFVLLAESFSTPLAIQFAATAPENLRGLVLCAGFTASPIQGWMRVVGSLLAPLLVRLPLPNTAIKLLLLGKKAPVATVAALRETISSIQPDVLAARLRAVLACDMALSQIAAPILYIRAENDRLVGISCLEEVLRCNPTVDVVSIEDRTS